MGPAYTLKVTQPMCRVIAYSTPTSDSHINFEVWLPPASTWNGKFEAVGNGGFIGRITYTDLNKGFQRGYAVAGSDTGHQSDNDESWAFGHPEKIIDWSYRAVHEMAVDAKQIVQAYYGTAAKLAYWDGCSTGGKQGLTEAQRYPNDFDGVVAGAPANYITHLQLGSEYISWVALKDGSTGSGYLPPSKLPVIHKAALAACDAKDGVQDGIITDPPRCHFEPKTIQCAGADGPDCLTAGQVDTVQKIYAGAKYKDGKQVFPGFEKGSELLWGGMTTGPEPFSLGTGFLRYMVFGDPKWDFRTLDVDRDVRIADERVGKIVNAIDPNLKSFKAHGGKLILYHGWADQGIAPGNTINYYESVVAEMGGETNTTDFARLFMAPGMAHCRLGVGPDTFDVLGALEQWREHSTPPAKMIASREAKRKVEMTRPLCPFPQVPRYKGVGSTKDAANFACQAP